MAKTFEDMFTHFDTIHKCDRHPARQTSRHHTSTCATLMHSTASQKAIHRKKSAKNLLYGRHWRERLCDEKYSVIKKWQNLIKAQQLLTSGSSASIWFRWMSSVVRKLNTTSCVHKHRPCVSHTHDGLVSGNALVSINVVALHQAQLVLGWVTFLRWVNHLGENQPPKSTQP